MTLRLLLDEDISQRVARGLRDRGIDATSVHELDKRGLPDENQLAFVTVKGRVLVTYNRADFQALDAQWYAQDRAHAGILWCSERRIPRRAIGDLIDALEAAARQYDSLERLCLALSAAE